LERTYYAYLSLRHALQVMLQLHPILYTSFMCTIVELIDFITVECEVVPKFKHVCHNVDTLTSYTNSVYLYFKPSETNNIVQYC